MVFYRPQQSFTFLKNTLEDSFGLVRHGEITRLVRRKIRCQNARNNLENLDKFANFNMNYSGFKLISLIAKASIRKFQAIIRRLHLLKIITKKSQEFIFYYI